MFSVRRLLSFALFAFVVGGVHTKVKCLPYGAVDSSKESQYFDDLDKKIEKYKQKQEFELDLALLDKDIEAVKLAKILKITKELKYTYDPIEAVKLLAKLPPAYLCKAYLMPACGEVLAHLLAYAIVGGVCVVNIAGIAVILDRITG